MPNTNPTQPLSVTEVRRLRGRAKMRLYALVNRLPDLDGDDLLLIHELIDTFYAADHRAENG